MKRIKSSRFGVHCSWVVTTAFLLAAGAATAAVVHTDSDGTTFDVTGGTLTVNVPTSGKTNSYDYVANILNNGSYAITDIVKDGPGVLNAKAASAYTGSWTINAGAVRCTANQSLGSTSGTAASKGAVTVKSGAAIKLEVDPCYVLNNRRIFVEGAGDGTAYKSAIVGKAATATDRNGIAGSSIQLTGDTDFWAEGGYTVDIGNSAFDLAGHTFNVCGKDWSWLYFRGGMVATNSNASADAVVKIPKSTNMKTTLVGLTTWLGGGRNVIDVTGNGRIYIEGQVEGDWTMKLKGTVRGIRTTTPQTTRSSYYIRLPTVINGAVTIGNGDNTNPGYGLELGGSITGDLSSSITVNRGAWVSFANADVDYAGSFTLSGQGDATYRCAAYFQAGAPFLTAADKTVSVSDSDIWMDVTTVRAISSLSITKGKSTVTGSAAGSTIPAITVTGGATNILDTPAAIGTYTLTQGRLVFGGTLPAISNLDCANDQVVDLNGKDVTVGTFTCRVQAFENPGTLTAENLVIDYVTMPAVIPAFVSVSGTGPIPVKMGGGNLIAGRYPVAYFAPGATVPETSRFTASVESGIAATFSTEPMASGEYAGYTALVVDVASAAPATPETVTDADGTTFACADRVLTVTVPGGLTNAYDYSSLVAAHFVTNIVKQGDGSLVARAMTSYTGDFTIRAGYFYIKNTGDLGRERFGVTRVLSPGALAVGDDPAMNGVIKWETVYLEGSGPDGRGALRGPRNALTTSTHPLERMTYILTGDVKLLHNNRSFEPYSSVFDVAGHTLTFRPLSNWAQMGYFRQCQITNSVPGSAGKYQAIVEESYTYPKMQLDGPSSWLGGTNNVIAATYRVYLGKTDGDWTFSSESDSVHIWGASSVTDPTSSDGGYYTGPVRLNKNLKLGINENTATNSSRKTSYAYPMSFYGPFLGASGKTLTVSGPVHLFSPTNYFEGTVVLNGYMDPAKQNPVIRNALYLHDGASFPGGAGKVVTVDDMDLWLGDGTAFRLPAFSHTTRAMTVWGGPRGDSAAGRAVFKSFDKTSTGDLTFDTPAIVAGDMTVSKGTFALGTNMPNRVRTAAELPVFSNLVFAAGTTFDMNGNAIEVPNIVGAPTLADAAALTVGESLTARGAEVAHGTNLVSSSSLAFAEGAVVRLTGAASLLKASTYTLCTAAGGVTVPGGKEVPVETDLRSNDWHARLTPDGKSLELVYIPQGTTILFR